MATMRHYGKPANRPVLGHVERVIGTSLYDLPGYLRRRSPLAEMKTNMKIGERKKRLREAQKKERECTLDELNAILWPSGKHMP